MLPIPSIQIKAALSTVSFKAVNHFQFQYLLPTTYLPPAFKELSSDSNTTTTGPFTLIRHTSISKLAKYLRNYQRATTLQNTASFDQIRIYSQYLSDQLFKDPSTASHTSLLLLNLLASFKKATISKLAAYLSSSQRALTFLLSASLVIERLSSEFILKITL